MKRNIEDARMIEFTSTQKERYNSIFPIVGEAATVIILNLKGRGRSCWKTTQSNIHLVNNPLTTQVRDYYNKLDQAIDLDETYSQDQCTQIVSETRYEAGMPAFQNKITHNCEQELFKLFLWEDVYSETDGKKTFIGYKPICRLKE